MKTFDTKLLFAGMACIFMCGNLMAQDDGFNLSAQRSEDQNVLRIPGEKKNHAEWVINPTPHKIIFDKSGKLDISSGLALKD